MEENGKHHQELVHLARLALSGRRQDIELMIRRIAKRLQASAPEAANQLNTLLASSPTRHSPLRGDAVAAVPVDVDSRLQLVRAEHVSQLEHEPIFAPLVSGPLDQIVAERQRHEALSGAGLTPTRSILFTGPPGVGKSLAARWLAMRLDRPLLVLDLAAVMSSYLGRTGMNLRHVLDYAKGVECVLLLDELDALAKRRDDASDVGELKRLVTVLLQEIDDWPASGVLVAATNHPDLLDPAVWRRFGMVVEFPMPDLHQVQAAIDTFLGPDTEKVAHLRTALTVLLHGDSFSDIERALLRARREAVVHGDSLEVRVLHLVRSRVLDLTAPERRKLAAELSKAGVPQRQCTELTGVSRDTIRRRVAESPQ